MNPAWQHDYGNNGLAAWGLWGQVLMTLLFSLYKWNLWCTGKIWSFSFRENNLCGISQLMIQLVWQLRISNSVFLWTSVSLQGWGNTAPGLRPSHCHWLDGEEMADWKSGPWNHRESHLRGSWVPEAAGRGERGVLLAISSLFLKERVKYCYSCEQQQKKKTSFLCVA